MVRRRLAVRIAIVGPDGVGKSTIATSAIAAARASGLRVLHLHFVPHTRRSEEQTLPEQSPHHQARRGVLLQVASVLRRIAFYWRAMARQGPFGRRDVDIVVQERTWSDQVVDPARYRLGRSGRRLALALRPLTPRFDYYVLLGGEGEVIAARKDELSAEETTRQIAEWRSLLANKRYLELDTVNDSEGECIRAVTEVISQVRSLRIRNQLKAVALVPGRLQEVATKRASAASRTLYKPTRATGIAARAIFVRMPVAARHEAIREMAARAAARIPISADSFAAIRSHGRDRAVLAIILGGEVREIVRLEWGAQESLERERLVLGELSGEDRFRVPRVLGYGAVGDTRFLRLSALDGASARSRVGLDTAVDLAAAMKHARGGRGVTHGDLAPWNIIGGTCLGLVDWEKASLDWEPYADLAYFLRSVRALPGPGPIEAAARRYASLCRLDASHALDELIGQYERLREVSP